MSDATITIIIGLSSTIATLIGICFTLVTHQRSLQHASYTEFYNLVGQPSRFIRKCQRNPNLEWICGNCINKLTMCGSKKIRMMIRDCCKQGNVKATDPKFLHSLCDQINREMNPFSI